jgi:hypothetical protein
MSFQIRPSRALLKAAAAGVLCAALLAPSTASAGTRSYAVDLELRMAVVVPQETAVFAGRLQGRPFGTSAAILHNRFANNRGSGRFTIYAPRGTVRGTSSNEVQFEEGNILIRNGRIEISGGTGRYRRATGTLSYEGILRQGQSIYELSFEGRIRY